MSREAHVQFCESLGVRFPGATHLLLLSPSRETALYAAEQVDAIVAAFKLTMKASHKQDLLLSMSISGEDRRFLQAFSFRHLGLQFDCSGQVSLSRDKSRKIQNLFRFAFRRSRRRWRRTSDPRERARTLVAVASETVERGVRNVAILDYYLKHVTEESQLHQLDRWLAEEVLSLVFGGHKKGHFAKISFAELRQFGLPSLVHRHRLIRHGNIDSPFFIWRQQKMDRAFKGTVASRKRAASVASGFSPCPEASAQEKPVREGGRLYMGVME